jgi:hypothetical protein
VPGQRLADPLTGSRKEVQDICGERSVSALEDQRKVVSSGTVLAVVAGIVTPSWCFSPATGLGWMVLRPPLDGVTMCPSRDLPASEPERVPAVGHDRLAGDPGGLVCSEQEDAACDVGGFGLAVDHLTAQAGIHDCLRDTLGHRSPGQ